MSTESNLNRINEKLSFAIDSFFTMLDSGKVKNPHDMPKLIFAQIYIQAFILELMIKKAYLLDNSEQAPSHHRIDQIYDELNDSTKSEIRSKFESNVKRVKKMEKVVGESLYIPDFDEVLQNNSDIVTNFKYEARLSNGSIVDLDFLKVLNKYIREKANEQ